MEIEKKLYEVETSLWKILWLKLEILDITSKWQCGDGLLRDWFLSSMTKCNPKYSANRSYIRENGSIEFQLLVEAIRLIATDRNTYLSGSISMAISRIFQMDLRALDRCFNNLKESLASTRGVDLEQLDLLYTNTFVTSKNIYSWMYWEVTNHVASDSSCASAYNAELIRPNPLVLNHPVITRKFDNIKFDKVLKRIKRVSED